MTDCGDVSRLSCQEAFEKLDDFLDRSLSPEELDRLRDHLDRCAHCACEYRYEESFLVRVREKLRRLEAPPALMERIHQRLRAEG